MQSLDLSRTLNRITEELKVNAIIEAFDKFITRPSGQNFTIEDSQKDEISRLIFHAQHSYRILSAEPLIHSVFEQYGVHRVLDETVLSRIVSRIRMSGSRDQVISDTRDRLLIEDLYRTMRLVQETAAMIDKLLIAPKFANRSEDDVLEIEVTDYGEPEVSIERINAILTAIRKLSDVLDLAFKTDRPLQLAFTDSGTKIVLAFTGAGELVDSIRKLFREFWDAVRFMKHDRFERDMDAVIKGLDTKKVISTQFEDSDLDKATAARLHRGINQRMAELVGAGAMLKDVEVPLFSTKDKLLEHFKSTKLLQSGEHAAESELPPGNSA